MLQSAAAVAGELGERHVWAVRLLHAEVRVVDMQPAVRVHDRELLVLHRNVLRVPADENRCGVPLRLHELLKRLRLGRVHRHLALGLRLEQLLALRQWLDQLLALGRVHRLTLGL